MTAKSIHIVLTLAVSASIVTTAALADEPQPSVQPPPVNKSPVVLTPSPSKPPLVAEPAADTPQYFLQAACANCQKGNDRIAAARIRDTVRLMRLELRQATDNGKLALERSIRELEMLAVNLEQGAATSLEQTRAAFARSQQALAYHYQQRAAELRLQQKFQQAGQNLQAAADSVAYGLNWVGQGARTKSRDVIVATRDFGDSLLRGTQANVQQLDAQTKALGQEIKRFGLRLVQPVDR